MGSFWKGVWLCRISGSYSQEIMGMPLPRVLVFDEVIVRLHLNCTARGRCHYHNPPEWVFPSSPPRVPPSSQKYYFLLFAFATVIPFHLYAIWGESKCWGTSRENFGVMANKVFQWSSTFLGSLSSAIVLSVLKTLLLSKSKTVQRFPALLGTRCVGGRLEL